MAVELGRGWEGWGASTCHCLKASWLLGLCCFENCQFWSPFLCFSPIPLGAPLSLSLLLKKCHWAIRFANKQAGKQQQKGAGAEEQAGIITVINSSSRGTARVSSKQGSCCWERDSTGQWLERRQWQTGKCRHPIRTNLPYLTQLLWEGAASNGHKQGPWTTELGEA